MGGKQLALTRALSTDDTRSMNIDESLELRAAHIGDASAIAAMSRLLVEHGLKWRWTT